MRVTTRDGPGAATLTVENTGAQVPPLLSSTSVEPFQRGTARTRTGHGGVGLGLTIVQRITDAHSGTLSLTPRPDGGLRVTVLLPCSPPQPDG